MALRAGTGVLGFLDFLPFVNLVKKVDFSEWAPASSSVRLVVLLLLVVVVRSGEVVLPLVVLLTLARLRDEVKGLERASWAVRRNILDDGEASVCICVEE